MSTYPSWITVFTLDEWYFVSIDLVYLHVYATMGYAVRKAVTMGPTDGVLSD